MSYKTKFRLGDRVRAINGYPIDLVGIVRSVYGEGSIAVEFEDWENGHDCLNLSGSTYDCKRSGWWLEEKDLVLVESKEDMRLI